MAKKDRSRAPSDEEGVAAVVPASLKGLDDDTVLIVTSFLPECRDVLSLSVTRVLPETAWRAAHKSLLPGLHVAQRRNQGQGKYWWCAMPDFYACGIADGPKSWRERFADGARLLSSDAAPTVVETEITTLGQRIGRVREGRTWWRLVCLREDGAALIENWVPPDPEPEGRVHQSRTIRIAPERRSPSTETNKRYYIHWWALQPDGSFKPSLQVAPDGYYRAKSVSGCQLAIVNYSFTTISIYALGGDQRIKWLRDVAIDSGPQPGFIPTWEPFGAKCAFNTRNGPCGNTGLGEFVFGLSYGHQITWGYVTVDNSERCGYKFELSAHPGDEHANEHFGYTDPGEGDTWQVTYDPLLSRLVFHDQRSRSIFIWSLWDCRLLDDAPDGETIARYWLEGGKLLHSLEVPHGRGVEALHFASDSLDDLVCKGGRTMIASDRTAVHVFEAGATAGRPAQIIYALDLAERGPEGWVEILSSLPGEYGWRREHDCQFFAGLIPSRSANGLAFVASLEEWTMDRENHWIRLDLESLELTTSGPTVSDPDRVVAEARADVVSPDGRSFLVPSTYEDAATGESRTKILRIAPDRGTASAATFGVVDAIFDSDQVLRGDDAVGWQETHGDLRRGSCLKCGTHVRFQTFMVGSLLVSYQDHQENTPGRPMCHCTNRVVLKVWRF